MSDFSIQIVKRHQAFNVPKTVVVTARLADRGLTAEIQTRTLASSITEVYGLSQVFYCQTADEVLAHAKQVCEREGATVVELEVPPGYTHEQFLSGAGLVKIV